MRKVGVLIFLSLLLISIGTVSALQPNSASLTIPSNVNSLYNISFYNNASKPVNISIDIASAKIQDSLFFSNIQVKPISFTIPAGESQSILFSFIPTGAVSSIPIPINISYTLNGVQKYFDLSAIILPLQNLISRVSAPKSVKPSSPLSFNVTLSNELAQDTPITLSYELNNSKNEAVANSLELVVLSTLGPDQFSLLLPLNSSLAPGNYSLSVFTSFGGETYTQSTNLTVSAYSRFSRVTSSNFNAFGGTYSVKITNTGNENLSAGNFSLAISQFNSAFVVSKSAQVASLAPGQSIIISYTISYLPIYLIVAIVIIAIFLFLYLNRKIVISKEVVEHKLIGGFVDVKIALKIKNVSKKVLKDLVIVDNIPAHALKVSSLGPKEGKISKVSNGLSITWREVELQPNDEILLMYEIKSKLGIVGSIDLHPASCSFASTEGKSYKKKSNSLVLNIK